MKIEEIVDKIMAERYIPPPDGKIVEALRTMVREIASRVIELARLDSPRWVCSECRHGNHPECKGTVGGDSCQCGC